MSEVKEVYESEKIAFEPKWFPLFRLLAENGSVTVMEAAQHLQMTHPHVSQIMKELSASRLITTQSVAHDRRSRAITLTTKGRKLAEELQPLWEAISSAVTETIEEADREFLLRLERVERAFKGKPLSKRVKERLKSKRLQCCRVLDYSPRLKKDFERLNREWLEKYFSVESVDIKYFENPEKEIRKKGGDIFFAELDGKIVGTCSLLASEDSLELGKMAVTESARGKGVGEVLAKEAIERAKKMGSHKLMLVTNSRLVPAMRLYEKLGFQVTFRGQHPKYKRGDVMMEISLS